MVYMYSGLLILQSIWKSEVMDEHTIECYPVDVVHGEIGRRQILGTRYHLGWFISFSLMVPWLADQDYGVFVCEWYLIQNDKPVKGSWKPNMSWAIFHVKHLEKSRMDITSKTLHHYITTMITLSFITALFQQSKLLEISQFMQPCMLLYMANSNF